MIGDKASEAQGGVARGVFLEISVFVGLVDDDLTEVVNRGEKGRTGADDNEGVAGAAMDFEPGFATLDHSEIGVHNDDAITKSFLKNTDELAGEGDFGDEENG